MEKKFMSGWRNWQTRTFEGRVVNTMGVQVPLPTPLYEKRREKFLRFFFFQSHNIMRQVLINGGGKTSVGLKG
jgi:hypothetical protein